MEHLVETIWFQHYRGILSVKRQLIAALILIFAKLSTSDETKKPLYSVVPVQYIPYTHYKTQYSRYTRNQPNLISYYKISNIPWTVDKTRFSRTKNRLKINKMIQKRCFTKLGDTNVEILPIITQSSRTPNRLPMKISLAERTSNGNVAKTDPILVRSPSCLENFLLAVNKRAPT